MCTCMKCLCVIVQQTHAVLFTQSLYVFQRRTFSLIRFNSLQLAQTKSDQQLDEET